MLTTSSNSNYHNRKPLVGTPKYGGEEQLSAAAVSLLHFATSAAVSQSLTPSTSGTDSGTSSRSPLAQVWN